MESTDRAGADFPW